jgi:hypothetical protein
MQTGGLFTRGSSKVIRQIPMRKFSEEDRGDHLIKNADYECCAEVLIN